jgi:hypothetical protein
MVNRWARDISNHRTAVGERCVREASDLSSQCPVSAMVAMQPALSLRFAWRIQEEGALRVQGPKRPCRGVLVVLNMWSMGRPKKRGWAS